jgi:hypothetical protein
MPNVIERLLTRRHRNRAGRCYELGWKYLMDADDAFGWKLVHGEVD